MEPENDGFQVRNLLFQGADIQVNHEKLPGGSRVHDPRSKGRGQREITFTNPPIAFQLWNGT